MATISEIISCGNKSLPRSIDINININRPQSETTTDLSIAVFVTPEGSLTHGAGRIQYFSTLTAVEAITGTTGERYKAAREFFSQPTRARQMAIGQTFDSAQSAFLRTDTIGALSAFTAVSDGSFAITIDGDQNDVTGLDFSSAADLAGVAAVIQAGLRAETGGGFTSATCELVGAQFLINSGTSGDDSTITVLSSVSPGVGTDISGAGFMNGQNGSTVPGYLPTTLTNELALIAEAARCSGAFVYAWELDRVYRDTSDQVAAAQWAEGRTAIMSATVNSPLTFDPNSTNDVAAQLNALALTRTFTTYHDNPNFYPGMSILARMLSVNYALANSTITAKFKDLPGVPTVGVSETQLSVIQSKRANTFTLVGNNARTFRDGNNVHPSWYMDDLINLDNYKEELEVAVLNMFLRNGKVPLTVAGQAIAREPLSEISDRYEFNGTFADRREQDSTAKAGFRILPAVDIVATPIENLTVSDRTNRAGPPFTLNNQLAGAIHTLAVQVNAFS